MTYDEQLFEKLAPSECNHDIEIEYNFKKRISRQVKDLETDIMGFNY